MMKKLIPILIAALAATAHAGPDPKAIQKEIDKEMQALKSEVSSGDLYGARGVAGDLVDLYDKLEDATSGSEKSEATKGKEDADKLEEVLMAADQLQQNAKASRQLTEQCARGKLMITEAIKVFEKKKDAAAIKILPEAAESARKLVEKPFAETRRLRGAMDGWYRTVGNFSPKLSVWSDIRGKLKDGSKKSYEDFVKAFDATEEACVRVAKGKDHPEVLAALKLIKAEHGERAADLAGLEKEIKEYATMVGGFRDWFRKDADSIATAFCNAGEEWKTGEIKEKEIVDVFNRVKGELTTRAKRITDEHDLLQKALAEVAKQVPAGSPDAKRIKDASDLLKKVQTSFTRAIAESPAAQGANNPKVRTKLEAGKLAHTEIQNSCKEKEAVIDGDNRVDCIKACRVIEIKPDTKTGEADGAKQIKSYENAFKELFKDRATFDDRFPRLAKECVKSGKLELSYAVAYYKFCPASYDALAFGPSLDARIMNPQVLLDFDLDGK